MLFKLLQLQKHVRDVSATVKDPTYVHTIISEFILKTFTFIMVIIIAITAIFGIVALWKPHPILWIIFGLGAGVSLGLLVIRWIVAGIIKRMVNRVYYEVRHFNNHS